MDKQAFQKELESYKIETDYLKHLTTLSTASILLAVTFYENIAAQSEYKAILFYALIGFLITVILSLYVNLRLVWVINDNDLEEEVSGYIVFLDAIGLLGGFLSFIISMGLLVYFVYKSVGL